MLAAKLSWAAPVIAKHVPMKSVKRSDFAGLVKYIIDEQRKQERVGYVCVTNCHSDLAGDAITEVINTQAQNKRAKSDKTYHLILSFRAGEHPDEAKLKAIEARICDALGYGGHQRVAAVHHDTDNLHVHIAINKIHPRRYTIHDPYNDHKTLAQLCEGLEREFGLERDNHRATKCGSQNRAEDMEHHAGIESLLGWIKRQCVDRIQAAQSWAELHQVLRENGLRLCERANGLVIQAEDGTTVKASSVGRDLSKHKLEARFGPFQPDAAQQASPAQHPARQYQPRPMRSRMNTADLYARYKAEQQIIRGARSNAWAKTRQLKKRRIRAAKRSGRLKREAIKLTGGGRLAKKLLYAMTSRTLKSEIQTINNQFFAERQGIYEKYRRRAWSDWLRAKAIEGDPQALEALRAREAAQRLRGNIITGRARLQPRPGYAVQDGITKTGTIIYRAGPTAVRDDGERLNVSRGATPKACTLSCKWRCNAMAAASP
jgi:hypothetical protein